jgi:hypothetical protein
VPVIAAHPVAAPSNKARLCPYCLDFVPPGAAVVCVHGFRDEAAGKVAYRIHLHAWSVTATDPKIRLALQELMGDRRAA